MGRIPLWPGRVAGAIACALVLAAGIHPAASAASDLLPDLVADPPANPHLDYYAYPDGSHDLLLRFDGFIHNPGVGALDVRGSRASISDPMTPLQRIYQSGGGYRDDPMPGAQLLYSNADGHHHWHLQDVARYSLWSQDGAAEVAPAMKVGFCLDDSQHVDGYGPSTGVYTDVNGRAFCQQNQPDALSLFEGISSGWRDLYDSSLALQWVVVSDVQPGLYRLREDVDPDGIVHESNETNPPAWSAGAVTIPGYVARAIAAPPAAYGQPQQITLGADAFGSPGDRRFRIVSPPAHGSLNVAAGTSFAGPSVTYTPAPGYTGPDQFTYQAVDSTSPYPVHPGTATVALGVGNAPVPNVVIDSAPTSIQVGHGVQLHATVSNDFSSLTWSVNGVDGGSSVAGKVTPNGFYTAPSSVPASGHVTIAVRSPSGAHDQRTVAITWPPVFLPSPGTSCTQTSRTRLLGCIATARYGRLLVAAVRPERAGVVSISAHVGRRRLGSCSAKTPKGRRFSCRLNVPRGLSLRKLSVVAKLRVHGKVVATAKRTGAPPVRRR